MNTPLEGGITNHGFLFWIIETPRGPTPREGGCSPIMPGRGFIASMLTSKG